MCTSNSENLLSSTLIQMHPFKLIHLFIYILNCEIAATTSTVFTRTGDIIISPHASCLVRRNVSNSKFFPVERRIKILHRLHAFDGAVIQLEFPHAATGQHEVEVHHYLHLGEHLDGDSGNGAVIIVAEV